MLSSAHTLESQKGELELLDVNYETFIELVRFLYTGKVPNIRSLALDMLAVSDRFGVTQLKDISARVLKASLRVDNALEIFSQADQHNTSDLKQETLDFIVENSASVLKVSCESYSSLMLLSRLKIGRNSLWRSRRWSHKSALRCLVTVSYN
jgi:hypothetical protein